MTHSNEHVVYETGETVAALYVETGGCYFDLPGVDLWDEARDARRYAGPYPVVAHPPCQRWGRYSESHPIIGKIATTGDDGGCFLQALAVVRAFGGVIEHPKDSKAFGAEHGFDLGKPNPSGWSRSKDGIGWICMVDQGHYGHFANKQTWLYASGVDLPELIWGKGEQRIHPRALELHGYEKARRIGMMAMVGGEGQNPHPRSHPDSLPRPPAEHRPHGQATGSSRMKDQSPNEKDVVMSERTFEVEVTQVVRVTLDAAKFDDAFMAEFRESFYSFDTLEEHAEHIGQLVARGVYDLGMSNEFIEGYGPANEMGIDAEILPLTEISVLEPRP